MKSAQFLVILVLSYLLTSDLFAQDTIPYPSMKEVQPSVVLSTQQVVSQYQYDNAVSNGLVASQHIWEFMIQIRSTTIGGVAPTGWDASRATRTNLVAVTWAAVDSTKDVGPGSSLSGFRIVSSGLPAIVQFYAVGYIPIPYGDFIPQEGTDDIFINSAQGRTIGPADPPSPFVPLAFLDTLIAMKNEAKNLDWIQQGDLSDLIDTRLSKARDHLESEDESGALEDLQAALNAVEYDCLGMGPISYLTTEACGLLQYNIKYLMEQLD
jgi:hypothetical protein